MPHAGDYRAVAFDYDGTLTDGGRMSAETAAALVALRGADYRLILVSGRRLQRIRAACSRLDLFDEIILENGAVAFCPATGTEELIAPPLEAAYGIDAALKAANVELATYIPAPSETNYSGAFLAGDQAACTAACHAFRDAVVQIAGAPLAW